VLCKLVGIEHIESAEDIVSDVFLLAAETWGLRGIPANPTAWLYAVSKNKAKDYLKHNALFTHKIAGELRASSVTLEDVDIDLSHQNIQDSQLQMMFALCHPCNPPEAQIGLSLSILCGFGAEEIADAFLTNKETIYKRLTRAKEKLRIEKVKIELPAPAQIGQRLEIIVRTLYLLFNEGYYSASQNTILRKDLCLEAMRLNYLLVENEQTNKPFVNAMLSLMCFHSSRFDARLDKQGEPVLYEDQDTSLWNKTLIEKGQYYLNKASTGTELSPYHLEAAIAYWHTQAEDSEEKWESILQLYNQLLQIEYSPAAALNRTYALAKARSKEEGILEAEKLNLSLNHLYHALLAELYTGVDTSRALHHYDQALNLTRSEADSASLKRKRAKLAG
jgi:RNA polymerase sigma factor (sigma-70 family)